MRPRERRDSGQSDLFKARLDQIVDLNHPLAKLARAVDWRFLEERFGAVYSDGSGQPPLPTRLMAGLAILKHMHDLSDEVLCERWIENPYYQLFCGEEFFVHRLPFDRSSMTRWRQRMGEEKLVALIQESLNVATRIGAAKPADFSKVIVDTTVQPKAVAFPTDAKLMHRARERLIRLAKKHGVTLRQSYERVGKRALIAHQRYAHAKQFKRANRALRTLRTYLGRVSATSCAGSRASGARGGLRPAPDAGAPGARAAPEPAGAEGLFAARPRGRMHRQGQGASPLRVRRQGFHRHDAPSFKAASSSPTPRRCRAILTTATRWRRSSQRSRRRSAPALPASSPIAAIAATTRRPTIASRSISQARNDASPNTSSASCVDAPAVEPVIGHAKGEHRMGRNYLAGQQGDATNAVLAAAGYNFRRLLAWLELWLSAFLFAMRETSGIKKSARRRLIRVLHGRLDQQPISTKPLANGAGHTFFNLWSEVASGPSAIDTRSGFRAAAWRSPRVGPPRLRLLSRDP